MSTRSRKAIDHRAIAKKLQELTNGVIHIDYDASEYVEGDDGSKGHLYSGFLDPEYSDDFLHLDDRGDVELQLIQELKRIGQFYSSIAKEVEQRTGKRAPSDSTVSAENPHGGGKTTYWGYIGSRKVVDWLAGRLPEMEFTWGEKFTTVRVVDEESEIILRNCEPTRMQLKKELHRVAAYYEYLAGLVCDVDSSPDEVENEAREPETIEWLTLPRSESFTTVRKMKVS